MAASVATVARINDTKVLRFDALGLVRANGEHRDDQLARNPKREAVMTQPSLDPLAGQDASHHGLGVVDSREMSRGARRAANQRKAGGVVPGPHLLRTAGPGSRKVCALFLVALLAAGGGAYAQDDPLVIKDGKVGIGKSDPAKELDVKGSAAISGQVEAGALAVNGNADLKSQVNAEALTVKGNADVKGNAVFGGNVGIGTGTPGVKLDVQGVGGDYAIDLRVSGRMRSNSQHGGLWLSDKDDGFVGNNDGYVGFWTKPAGTSPGVWTFQIEKSTGNVGITGSVGIGVQSPQMTLDVDGWIGSSTSSHTTGGWRLGRWPGYDKANKWVYLSRSDKSGTASTYQNLAVGDLYVKGNLILQDKTFTFAKSAFFANEWNVEANSDRRLKRDIVQIAAAREKVRRLRGIAFHWNDEALEYFTSDIEATSVAHPGATIDENRTLWRAEREARYRELTKTTIGVVAQEVEAVLPEAVSKDDKGYKRVKYQYLIPLLIEALKEQDRALEEQAAVVARQEAQIERLNGLQNGAQEQAVQLAGVKVRITELEARLAAVLESLAASGRR